MNFRGSCHCGRVAFEVDGELKGATACNCSMCERRGSLLWFVPQDKLRVLSPDDAAGTYLFYKHVIKHRFCTVCGIHCYGEARDPQGNPVAAINVRCLEGIDLAALSVRTFDGRSR